MCAVVSVGEFGVRCVWLIVFGVCDMVWCCFVGVVVLLVVSFCFVMCCCLTVLLLWLVCGVTVIVYVDACLRVVLCDVACLC